ncbi:MAG: ATP-binding protein, partial [Treponema sp.]|nr:ATP-binding protein [Treponema sp.]
MNILLDKLDHLCAGLRLDALPAKELYNKLAEGMSPIETVLAFLEIQHQHKADKAAALRVRNARFPRVKTIKEYDFSLQDGVTAEQMNRLCDFVWLEQAF